MKILLISGFLGAGKTTFIKELVRQVPKKYVVLENEYGSRNVDSTLLQESAINVWELTEGCICCTVQADFNTSVLTIANSLDPEVLIVEPTGLGLLSSILKNMKRLEYERIQVLSPLTLVDYQNFDQADEDLAEYYEDQIRHAGTILVSKSEGVRPEDLAAFTEPLKKLNPGATIPEIHYSQLPKEFFERLLETDWLKNLPLDEVKDLPDMMSLAYDDVAFPDRESLATVTRHLLAGRFGRILRGKGYFPVEGQWLQFDLVDSTYELVPIRPQDQAHLVLIGPDLKTHDLVTLFAYYRQQPL